MGTLQTNPPTVPNTVSDSWQVLVERDAIGSAGKNKITLTNWDETTTKPLLAQGSIIDIDGSLAVFAVNEAITDVAADGTVYLKFVVSGSTVTPEFTAEVPTWYADKGGWYNASGERYSGHVMTKAATSYSDKKQFGRDALAGDLTLNTAVGGIDTSWTGIFGTKALAASEVWLLPKGAYMIAVLGSNVRLSISDGATWNGGLTVPQGFIVSDGVHYRITNGTGTGTVYYRKIW